METSTNAGDKPLILIVDNDPVSQRLFSAIYRDSEFHIEFTSTAGTALPRVATEKIAILITEIVLPDNNGFELRKRVRLSQRDLAIIFVSSVLDSAGRKLLENLSNDPNTFFLRKPILKDPMIALTRQIMSGIREREMHRHYFEQLQSDLSLASKMQQLMLPDWITMEKAGFFMSADYMPHSHLSGDYFDLLHISDDRYFFVIGDISGHGVRAALHMSVIQSLTRVFIKNSKSNNVICDYLNELNRQICVDFDSVFYLTCLAAVIDVKAHTMEYLSAGHPGFYLYKESDGSFTYRHSDDAERNIPVGWLTEFQYQSADVAHCDIPEGTAIMALTDGVIERSNQLNEMLGLSGVSGFRLTPAESMVLLPFMLEEQMRQAGYTNIQDDMLILFLGFMHPAGQARHQLIQAIPQSMSQAAQLSSRSAELVEAEFHNPALAYRVELAIGEFLNNIIVHALENAMKLTPRILFKLVIWPDRVETVFVDRGKEWNYQPQKRSFNDNPEDDFFSLAQAGRGMRIIEEIVTTIERRRIGSLNVTKFVFEIPNG